MASPAGIPPPPGPGEDDYTVPKFAKMPEVATATQVATQFAQAFYQAFAADPASCAQFFQAASVMTFEGANCVGAPQISAKLAEVKGQLPAGTKHEVLSIDGQPSCAVNGGVIVYITCRFMDRFAQEVFHLLPNAVSVLHSECPVNHARLSRAVGISVFAPPNLFAPQFAGKGRRLEAVHSRVAMTFIHRKLFDCQALLTLYTYIAVMHNLLYHYK
jgi:hypothetical protein